MATELGAALRPDAPPTAPTTGAMPFPGYLPERVAVKALYLGERLDTRGIEKEGALGTAPLVLALSDRSLAVLFRFGAIVLFNVDVAAEQALLDRVTPFLAGPLAMPETDVARLQIKPDAETQTDLSGTIYIREVTTERLQLIADVLAKSVILAHYESRIAGIFDRIEPLATALHLKGRAGTHGRALMRQIGDVLAMQHRMVGRVETGEKPELLWEHPELERLYLRLAEEYELRERSRALERKLDVIARTVETLLGLVQNRSSLRVEWYIVALIVAELFLSIYTLVLH
jgi:required for meiotic nuclear division protein 1